MKVPLLVAVVYAVLFTTAVFSLEGPRKAGLAIDQERIEDRKAPFLWLQTRACPDPISQVAHWCKPACGSDDQPALYRSACAIAFESNMSGSIPESDIPASIPSGLITVSTVSACNPRIKPCF